MLAQSSTMFGTIAELIREVYPDPEPYTTAEAFQRAGHDDIVTMSDVQLRRERLLALLRDAIEYASHAASSRRWLDARILRLEAEAAQRRSRARKQGRQR